MMEVFFNSQKMDWALPDLNRLPDALGRIEREYLKEGNFISDVLLDDISIIENGNLNLDRVPEEKKAAAKCVRIVSCTMEQLAQEAVQGAKRYLAGLETPVSQVANQFSSGDFDRAFKNLAILLDGISSLVSLLSSLETSYHLNYASIMVDGTSVRDHIHNLRNLLTEIVRAQEGGDSITLADTMEYELKPQLREWREILQVLWSSVGGGS